MPTRSETSKSGAEGGRGGPSTADQLEYMADLIRELQGLAEQSGFSALAGLLGLAYAEARQQRARLGR